MIATPVEGLLACVATLLGLSALCLAIGPRRATSLVYGGCLVVCLVGCAIALGALLDPTLCGSAVILPLGLPWVGARFQLDALAAVFLVILPEKLRAFQQYWVMFFGIVLVLMLILRRKGLIPAMIRMYMREIRSAPESLRAPKGSKP